MEFLEDGGYPFDGREGGYPLDEGLDLGISDGCLLEAGKNHAGQSAYKDSYRIQKEQSQVGEEGGEEDDEEDKVLGLAKSLRDTPPALRAEEVEDRSHRTDPTAPEPSQGQCEQRDDDGRHERQDHLPCGHHRAQGQERVRAGEEINGDRGSSSPRRFNE